MYISVITPSISENPTVDVYIGGYDDPIRTEVRLSLQSALELSSKLAKAIVEYQDKTEKVLAEMQKVTAEAEEKMEVMT